MARPAVIATDLDGTFLDSKGEISAENAAAFRSAAAAGIELVVATGRPWRWLDVLDELADLNLHVLASNGAVRYDLRSGCVVDHDSLDHTVITEVMDDLAHLDYDLGFALEHVDGWSCDPLFASLSPLLEEQPRAQLANAPAVKWLIRCGSLSSEELAAVVGPVVVDRLTCTWSYHQESGMVELSSAGVSKASGLHSILDRLGIDPAEAAAFGDMPNDLEMLQLVGQPFAMANAHSCLHELGIPVVGHHDESGVGRTVVQLINS